MAISQSTATSTKQRQLAPKILPTNESPNNQPAPSKTSSKQVSISALLEQRSLSIINSLNNRDIPTPFQLYATPDYTYHHPLSNGQIIIRDSKETQDFLKWLMVEQNSLTMVDVVSIATQMEEGGDYATVWVSLMAHRDKAGGERESVALYSWRREADGEWRWWKQSCANTVPSFPF